MTMFKIAGSIIDFTDDPRFAENAEFRALFGDQLVLEKHASLSNGHFALVLRGHSDHKRFPLYNKIAAALSILHLKDYGKDLPEIFKKVAATHLQKAAKAYDLNFPAELAKLVDGSITTNTIDLEKIPEVKQAAAETDEEKLAAMANWWVNNEREMTLDERNTKANILVKKADALGYDVIEPRILAYNDKDRVGPLFKLAVKQRRQIMSDLGKKEAALEVDELFSDITVDHPRDAVERLKVYDSKYKLASYYSYGRILDPYRAVYTTSAPAKEAHDRTLGLQYKLQTMAAEGGDLHAVLSRDGIERFKSDPVGVYQDLPKIVQDYIMAKFDSRMKEPTVVNPHESSAMIRKRTSNLRAGISEYKNLPYDKGSVPEVQAMPIKTTKKVKA